MAGTVWAPIDQIVIYLFITVYVDSLCSKLACLHQSFISSSLSLQPNDIHFLDNSITMTTILSSTAPDYTEAMPVFTSDSQAPIDIQAPINKVIDDLSEQ
jgi:hypothetical protein